MLSVQFINKLRGRLERKVEIVFGALFLGTGLAAYNIGPIPIPWLAQAGFVFLAVALILGLKRVRIVPGGLILIVFMVWALIVNGFNVGLFAQEMPPLATSPYELFIIARYINLLSFTAVLYLAFWLLSQGHSKSLTNAIILIGVFVSLASLYAYIAHSCGLPEPPRTRLGTSGGDQATTFSYGYFFYNRALGTFREPSHMAEWLLLPLFFSLTRSGKTARVSTFLMGSMLLLTVSLGGIISVLIGIVAAILISNPLRMKNIIHLVQITLVVLILAVGLRVISNAFGGEVHTIYSLINYRILEFFEGGVYATNIGFIYEFVSDNPLPILGYGLGNANIFFSNLAGNDSIMSYLSLYVNVLFSTGIVGFGLLLFFLLRPIVRAIAKKGCGEFGQSPIFLMTFLAYLVFFGVHAEELTVPFAISTAYLTYQGALGLRQQGQGHTVHGRREC